MQMLFKFSLQKGLSNFGLVVFEWKYNKTDIGFVNSAISATKPE